MTDAADAATNDDIARKVIAIIAEQAMIDPAEVRPEATPEQLGVDSLGLVEAVFAIEEAFDIAGPFDESLVNASLDAVFNQSLRAAGRTLLYVREARALHHYKTSLAGFLRRQIAYARYRAWSSSVELYPADRSLAVEVAAAALAVGLVGAGALTLALAERCRARRTSQIDDPHA